ISDGVQSIAAVAEEQAASAEEIASAMEDILNKVAQGQVQAEEVEDSSKELMEQITVLSHIRKEQSALVEDLKEALAFYKLNGVSEKAGLVPLD
ncbi:MAG: methyl-accepting chemotaxis protein, partial [Acetomicrobium sp.]